MPKIKERDQTMDRDLYHRRISTLIDADTIPEVIKLGKKRGIDPDNIMSIVLYKHVKIEN